MSKQTGYLHRLNDVTGPDYGPFFYDSPDADLFVWGIGLANLCRYYKLDVQISDPLIPEELLISAGDYLRPAPLEDQQPLANDVQETADVLPEGSKTVLDFCSLFYPNFLLNNKPFTLRFPF